MSFDRHLIGADEELFLPLGPALADDGDQFGLDPGSGSESVETPPGAFLAWLGIPAREDGGYLALAEEGQEDGETG